jgi:hypothetical protein
MLSQLAQEIDRLNKELAEQKDKTMQTWVKMLDMVPKKDHDAAIGSLKVCQNTIETLTQALSKIDPKSPEVGQAWAILAGLEAIITPDRMEGGYNFTDNLRPTVVFGTVKKEYKP